MSASPCISSGSTDSSGSSELSGLSRSAPGRWVSRTLNGASRTPTQQPEASEASEASWADSAA